MVVPLLVMTLLFGGKREPHHTSGSTTPVGEITVRVPPEASAAPSDLVRKVTPALPEPTDHAALTAPEPTSSSSNGDLPTDAMATVPAPLDPAASAPSESPPPPWHGDLTIEAMPLFPEPANHVAMLPIIGHATAAAAPEPICLPNDAATVATFQASERAPSSLTPAAFGRALAHAARAQTEDFVVYNPRYMTLSYPRGDTLALYGVCTDVVVRAYRTLGIDLQELIHTSRLGRGDPSIDHRRVETVGRFFARYGTQLEPSEFPEDYRPGDIVTYHRPGGRVSQHHIAVVSDLTGPSGRPLIIHNRGWGPQIEDALFVDRMTGHYRFTPSHAEAYTRARQPRAPSGRRQGVVSIAARR